MKKTLSILCITAMLSLMSVTAFAVSDTTDLKEDNSGRRVEFLQRRSEKLDKRLQFLQFRQSLDEKRTVIRENRTDLRDLAIENTQLRKDIVDSLLAVKENGGTISPETQEQLKAYKEQVKEITSSLKETKGDIRDILAANRQNIKEMNYKAVDSAYSEVIAIKESRMEQITRMNEILKSMKPLL